MFGYFADGYQLLYEEESVSDDELLMYFPLVQYRDTSVIGFADSDWIMDRYDIESADGEIYIKSIFDDAQVEPQKMDFDLLWR
jgi:hypothetical protein